MTRTGHGDLGSSLILIFPLLLAYEIGVLFAGRVNGADLVTRVVLDAAGSRAAYLALYALVAVGFLLWIRHTRRWGTLRLALAGPVLLEAAVYALTLGAAATLIVDRLLGLGLGAAVISALGAGVHEELVFRLALISGLVALVGPIGRSSTTIVGCDRRAGGGSRRTSDAHSSRRSTTLVAPLRACAALRRPSLGLARRWLSSCALSPRFAVAFAIAGSSLLFAAAHHVGAHGEPWAVHAFAFRAVCGVAFGAMFWFRSLAHAVYAHVLYDVLVAASR